MINNENDYSPSKLKKLREVVKKKKEKKKKKKRRHLEKDITQQGTELTKFQQKSKLGIVNWSDEKNPKDYSQNVNQYPSKKLWKKNQKDRRRNTSDLSQNTMVVIIGFVLLSLFLFFFLKMDYQVIN